MLAKSIPFPGFPGEVEGAGALRHPHGRNRVVRFLSSVKLISPQSFPFVAVVGVAALQAALARHPARVANGCGCLIGILLQRLCPKGHGYGCWVQCIIGSKLVIISELEIQILCFAVGHEKGGGTYAVCRPPFHFPP
ncbi:MULTISPECIES: hypothetical protein [unclassified Azospirillum]|uniref:hypothetical protein n=1 Tax=unclassified Azospirillum TaxID=2630922 RepID=UPI0011779FCF|nr:MULTISPECIES: hypothetical protein [unclassified Azospirillum]